MIRNLAQFESEIEGFVGHFQCAQDTPIPYAKQMLLEFIKILGQMEDAAIAQDKKAKEEAEEKAACEAKIVPME